MKVSKTYQPVFEQPFLFYELFIDLKNIMVQCTGFVIIIILIDSNIDKLCHN